MEKKHEPKKTLKGSKNTGYNRILILELTEGLIRKRLQPAYLRYRAEPSLTIIVIDSNLVPV